ncbi:MAG: hypothetical protein PHQ12_12355 [Chthoniobacteraceae bacterium]|nr:hypothetical protein [Chthoniobacteraceae bacterium]
MRGIFYRNMPTPSRPGPRWLDVAALVLALGGGIAFWLFFFGWGSVRLRFEDWPNQAYYLDILRLAVSHGQIPWIGNWDAHATDKFLAVPETLLAPQIALLPWLSNGVFAALEVCLLYAAGVAGWWRAKRVLGWTPEAFLLAVVAASFNGFVVSHLAIGHLMWAGCFLAPWLLLSLREILADAPAPRCWLPLAFWLFGLFLLGAFHLAVWWIFFTGFAALARPKTALLPAVCAVGAAGAMAAFRIVPALVFVRERYAFITGYPSLGVLWKAFTQIHGYEGGTVTGPVQTVVTAEMLGWWEFNHYTGLGLLLFVLGAAGVALWNRRPPEARALAAGCLGILVLSYGRCYALLYPLPLFHSERVVTRFVSVAFLGLLFLGLRGLENPPSPRARRLVRLLCIVVLAGAIWDAWAGAQPWILARLEASHPFSAYFPELETLRPAMVEKAHQARYHAVVLASGAFSLASLALAVWAALRRPRSRA